MAKYRIVGGATLSFGKIWESKDGRYLYRYSYYSKKGSKGKGFRSLMRANMPAWKGVKSGRQ